MGTERADHLPRFWIPLAPRSQKCHLFQWYRTSCPVFFKFFSSLVYLIPRISLVAERGRSLTKQQGIKTKSNYFAEVFHTSKRSREMQTLESTSNFLECTHSWSSQLIKPIFNVCISINTSVELRWLSSGFPEWGKLGFLPVFLQPQLCRAGKQYKKGGKTWTRPSVVGGYERQSE